MAKQVRKKRKNYTPEEKVRILRRYLVDQVPVSDLCDQYSIHPTMFYRWQKEFFENGGAAFSNQHTQQEKRMRQKIECLEEKLNHKNEVVAELMEEHLRLKKTLGLL